MENKPITLGDIKQFIITYHDHLRSLIDIENQTILCPLENKLNSLHDKSKIDDEQSESYYELKKKIDEIYKSYMPQIEKVEEITNSNLDLINTNFSNRILPPNKKINEILSNVENYIYCKFFPSNTLHKRHKETFPRGVIIFCDWYLSENDLIYLR
jgi:hypothetical protein